MAKRDSSPDSLCHCVTCHRRPLPALEERRARLAPAPSCSPQARVLSIHLTATHHLDGARFGDAVTLLSQGFQINDSLWHKGA